MKKMNYALLSTMLIFGAILPDQVPTTIFQEVRAGNTQAIRKRLENCEDCAKTDENGNNALHIAAEEGSPEHEEIINMLTTEPDYSSWGNWLYGCIYAPTFPNKNQKNKQGKVPLRSAIDRGNVGATDKLIAKGADPKITDAEGASPIFAVVKENKPQLLSVLVKHQLMQQKLNGQNVLHYAINLNQLPMVDRLATDNSLTQEEDNEGKIPAMLAAEKNDARCLRILHVKGVNMNARNQFGRQPIHSSAMAGSYEAAKYLLENAGSDVDSTDNNANTPLLLSGAQGKKNVLELFVAYKADTKKRNKQGKDVLDLATENKQYHIIEGVTKIPGININAQDAEGRTKFMLATARQDHSMMNALCNAGADMNITDHNGNTPLHVIAKNGDTNGLSMLRNSHAKYWNQTNNKGDTPTFVATQNGHLDTIVIFMHGGASLEGTNKDGETIFHQCAKSKKASVFTTIMEKYAPRININTQSKAGFSPIHYAAAYDDPEMMYAFAQRGASYSDTTKLEDDTLAHTAAKSGALKSLKDLQYRKPMMMQQRNKNNHTPFITAALNGKIDAVDFLLCEDDFINRDISIAINLAHQKNHTHIVRFLKKKEEDRMDACVALSNQPQAIMNVEKDIQYLHQQLVGKNAWHLVNVAFYQPSSPRQYCANELYYMTEAQRTQIALEYKDLYRKARDRKKELKRELDTLIAQEQEEIRKEHERIRQARKAQRQREKEAIKAQIQAQEAAEKRAEEDRIRKEQQKEFDHYAAEKQKNDAIKAQDAELKKHNEQKEKDDLIAGQQAILDQGAANKALTDAAKHKAALEKQQEYVPMNLQPSAPPMEENKAVAAQCAACGGKAPSKPLPCVKCKKKIEGICSTCVKQYAGRCPHCFELKSLGIEKQKGECCIGVAACTEEKGVTVIPCTQCKKESSEDRICNGCLQACINDNIKKGQKDKCPRCTQNTLDQNLAEKILAQQK